MDRAVILYVSVFNFTFERERIPFFKQGFEMVTDFVRHVVRELMSNILPINKLFTLIGAVAGHI